MDQRTIIAERSRQTWMKAGSGDFEAFKALVGQTAQKDDWPFASAVVNNVLIYDGDAVRKLAQSPENRLELMAEWVEVFLSGPGVIVIRHAIQDKSVIDEASATFEAIITEQRRTNEGGGDHFAKPGANDRIWNAAEKHCIASPENFARYFGNVAIGLVSRAWLGDGYQVTAQVNRVNPGGAAQTAHRDYHLGFMTAERLRQFPTHVHRLSPVLTLQGAVAHCDMPVESGPTLFLPYSQIFLEGYVAFGRDEYQDWFREHHVQLPLEKGDAVFFNPALMHAAGPNISKDIYRMANLLQVSSAFGRAIEAVDRTRMSQLLYPVLLEAQRTQSLSGDEIACAIAACAEGYPFPTNLDNDLPVGGLAPNSQTALMRELLERQVSAEECCKVLDEQAGRKRP
ncbi:phytanoyl-CoA dioxygenase family protein [Hoeflea sp. TYP-13]|uniref:phytanoyl-CoA dioxygenase family protein n=1 Tax=Hoeflea sp. TYP-13 TaxID=3230023 RepID=UPI0034C6006C